MTTILPNHVLKLIGKADREKLGVAGLLASECREIAVAKCERELQGQLVNLLRLNGVRFVINQRFGVKTTVPKGTPDILFGFKGALCAWEVKMPGEKPKPEQVDAMRDMTTDGWRCEVVTSYPQGLAILKTFAQAHPSPVTKPTPDDDVGAV